MTLLRVVVGDTGPVLRGDRVTLRHPSMADFQAWVDLRAESRDFLKPWEPTWPLDDLTRAAFRRRIKRYHRDIREDSGAPFFVFRTGDDRLLGGLTLSAIRRGVSQSASLGYWMGERWAGQGYMSDAVRTVLDHAFDDLRLHRIEAASMPTNSRSIALLEKAGFTREGFARRYLLIDGRWQDHVLFAMLADDPRPLRR
jgi:ribosomal-protein-alanine N-acetyltransferase